MHHCVTLPSVPSVALVTSLTGEDVYRGYVDDPRNTDNAWMETVAQNFHMEESGGILDKVGLQQLVPI